MYQKKIQGNLSHTTNGLIKKRKEIMMKSKRHKTELKQLPHINQREIQDIRKFCLKKVEGINKKIESRLK